MLRMRFYLTRLQLNLGVRPLHYRTMKGNLSARVRRALEIAAHFNMGVCAPFTIKAMRT